MIDTYGTERIPVLLGTLNMGKRIDEALPLVYGMTVEELDQEWRNDLLGGDADRTQARSRHHRHVGSTDRGSRCGGRDFGVAVDMAVASRARAVGPGMLNGQARVQYSCDVGSLHSPASHRHPSPLPARERGLRTGLFGGKRPRG